MKNLLILLLGLAIGAGGAWFVTHHSHADAKEEHAAHGEEAKHSEESHIEGEIKVTKKQQAAAGLKVTQPEAVEIPKRIKAYGRVLDPSAVATLALDVQAARAALDATTKDFERVKILYAQNQNASARALETAEALVKRDRALLALAEAKLQTAVGPALSQRNDFVELVYSITQMKSALVRIDIVGAAPETLPKTFLVAPLANEKNVFEAELLGPAPVAEANLQGQGFLGLIRTNALAANIALVASFDAQSQMEKGLSLPSGAALQDGADTFVFIQTGEEAFRKVEIEIEGRKDHQIFLTGGLSATNRVVVEGAHQILSITKAEPAE